MKATFWKTKIEIQRCSGYHYCTTSFNKAWTQILRRCKSCSRYVEDSWWRGSLTIVLAGNKVKNLLSVRHTPKTINHNRQIILWDNTHITSMKIVLFLKSPTAPFVQLHPKFFYPFHLGRPISNEPPFSKKTNELKKNIIQGWLLYLTRPFLQVGLRFQYQLINLVWLSTGFFLFSWNQSRPQSNFKELKTLFCLPVRA